jgi:hypothetical protein
MQERFLQFVRVSSGWSDYEYTLRVLITLSIPCSTLSSESVRQGSTRTRPHEITVLILFKLYGRSEVDALPSSNQDVRSEVSVCKY